MKMRELIDESQPDVHFPDYFRESPPSDMPLLDANRLAIMRCTSSTSRTILEGDVGLLVQYKSNDAGIVSAHELDDGREWKFPQVMGSKSSRSYRVASCLEWQRCLADQWRRYAEMGDSEVLVLSMPPWHGIVNITEAANVESAQRSYAIVRSALGMRFSDDQDMYVADVQRSPATEIVSPLSIPSSLHS